MKIRYLILFGAMVAFAVAGGLFRFFSKEEKQLRILPRERPIPELVGSSKAEVGTGWSTREDPKEAVKEAVEMALRRAQNRQPDLLIIFPTSGSDLRSLLSEARILLGKGTRVFGGTSDSRAVMTNSGFIKAAGRGYLEKKGARHALAVMTITSKNMVFGVGAAGLSAHSSPQEAAGAALFKAMENAGKTSDDRPKITLTMSTYGIGDEVVQGIEDVLGKEAVVLGGTTGGPKFAVVGGDDVYDEGISMAVMYTDLPVGWAFEGGFDVGDMPSGIATRVDGHAILEIDNRPALDIYDEWLGGRIKRLQEEFGDPTVVKDMLSLNPICRQYTSSSGHNYFLYSHPWPKDDKLQEKAIMTSTKIRAGERVFLSQGTWEQLMNRIGNLPKTARTHGEIGPGRKPLFGIAFLCGGVMGTIPENEREKLSFLINYANDNVLFISVFTWGEQGHFSEVGNKHGNLLTSFLVVAE